jgi:hypothetical protein
MKITLLSGVILTGCILLAGCGREATMEALRANNPAPAEAPVGRPPVPPESLTITPTGVSPLAAPAMAPDPILPTMDEVYKTRWLPVGLEPSAAKQPAGHEGPPEGRYQPEPRGDQTDGKQ